MLYIYVWDLNINKVCLFLYFSSQITTWVYKHYLNTWRPAYQPLQRVALGYNTYNRVSAWSTRGVCNSVHKQIGDSTGDPCKGCSSTEVVKHQHNIQLLFVLTPVRAFVLFEFWYPVRVRVVRGSCSSWTGVREFWSCSSILRCDYLQRGNKK